MKRPRPRQMRYDVSYREWVLEYPPNTAADARGSWLELSVQDEQQTYDPLRTPFTHTFRYAVATVCACFSLVGLLHASPPPAEDQITILTPEAMPYQADANAPDIQVAVVSGDPRSGFYTLRVKFPPGIKTPPHYHPDTRTVTVISGKYYFGEGDIFDAVMMHGYEPGTVIVVPAGKPHFSWAKDGEVIIQEAGVGPTGVTRTSPPSP